MTDYLFEPPSIPALPVLGEIRRFAVRRIFCVGRNYEEHAREMGHVVDREKPFYFCKSAHALAQDGETIGYPPGTSNYHFEVELVVALGAAAFKTTKEAALDAVYGYAVGLDMTRRDLQLSERAKQRPWTLGKDVEASAPVSAIAPAARIGHPVKGAITLSQNGVVKQSADLAELVWSVPEIIAHLSGFCHLEAGDLIFTGTPAGVAALQRGDRFHAELVGVAEMDSRIV